jgi:hypothetical protein
MKPLSEVYKKHEFGIEAPEGHLLESSEDYLEELNDLLKERDEARELAEWMRDMMDPWAECDDTSFPWDKEIKPTK